MVSLCAARATILPLASETKIACTLSTDVVIAEVVIECLWVWKGFVAIDPLALIAGGWRLLGNDRRSGCGGSRGRGRRLLWRRRLICVLIIVLFH